MMKMIMFLLLLFTMNKDTASLYSLLLLTYYVFSALAMNQPVPYFSSVMIWDSLSSSLILLSMLIFILMNMAMKNYFMYKTNISFTIASQLLLTALVFAFSVHSSLLFYIMFEASIIPTFIIILGWGNQPERSQAGVYMLLYTVTSSLPLLISLLLWTNEAHSTSFFLSSYLANSILTSIWAFFFLLAMAVKLPLYLTHLWLPKAHVEAPVAGSMILAAILLKLGGYGLIRFSQMMFTALLSLSHLFMVWAIVGGMAAGILCIFQSDIKMLIALSSVAHMSLVMAGVMSFSQWGFIGAQCIMIGHAFCSSALFYAANIHYDHSNTRNMYLLKGSQVYMPAMSLWWFLLCSSNMASPPSLNLLGESLSILSTSLWASPFMLILSFLVMLSAAYSLYLYSIIHHGAPIKASISFTPLQIKNHLIIFIHWLPLNLLFLNPSYFISMF